MYKKFLILFTALISSITLVAQLEVKPGSFKEVSGFVNIDPEKQTDDNDQPYAVVKVRTENIDNKQRRELNFQGDARTFFEIDYRDGEVWLYISYYASFIKISHPDLSSTEFYFPFDMKPKKGYELTLVNTASKESGKGSLTIKTKPESGAIIVLNGKVLNQKTPFTNDMIAAGQYEITVSKDRFKPATKIVTILDGENKTIEIEMPSDVAVVTLNADNQTDIYIDGIRKSRGTWKGELYSGNHDITYKKRDYHDSNRTIIVEAGKNKSFTLPMTPIFNDISITGYKFLTLNASINQYGNLSYGLTFGHLKESGWFVSAMSSFDFTGYKPDYECDEDMLVNGYYPGYNGNTSYTAVSIIGGFIMRIVGPLSFKVGAGYGMRAKCYETTNGYWVKYTDISAQGLDLTAGLQYYFRGWVISLDGVTTNFKIYEAKIGLGFGIRNK